MSAEINHVPKKNSEGTRKKRWMMKLSERIREWWKIVSFDELADEVAQREARLAECEHIVRLARDIEHPDYPDYDWPNGSTEYEARRKRLRDALLTEGNDANTG